MSKLDQDFIKTAEQINAKVAEATLALREANRLAEEAGLPALFYTQYIAEGDDLDSLDEATLQRLEADDEWDGESTPLKIKMDMIDISDLEGQIENAGWQTSSSYC